MHKWFRLTEHWTARALDKKCLETTYPTDPMVQIHNVFTKMFPMMSSTKMTQMFQRTTRSLDKKYL